MELLLEHVPRRARSALWYHDVGKVVPFRVRYPDPATVAAFLEVIPVHGRIGEAVPQRVGVVHFQRSGGEFQTGSHRRIVEPGQRGVLRLGVPVAPGQHPSYHVGDGPARRTRRNEHRRPALFVLGIIIETPSHEIHGFERGEATGNRRTREEYRGEGGRECHENQDRQRTVRAAAAVMMVVPLKSGHRRSKRHEKEVEVHAEDGSLVIRSIIIDLWKSGRDGG